MIMVFAFWCCCCVFELMSGCFMCVCFVVVRRVVSS